MNFINSFGDLELGLTLVFLIAYVLYIIRLYRTKKQLNQNYRRFIFKFCLRTFYFSLLIITLLGPAFGTHKEEVKSVGKDIFILVDLSESMNADDVQPTRLQKAKHELLKINQTFKSDRLGLIIFTSEAFLYCPLTYDKNIISLYINSLNTNLILDNGTEFTPALDLVIEKFDSAQESLETGIKNRIALLISDGEEFGEGLNDIIDDLKDKNVHVFSLGIGTEKGSQIRFKHGFKKDKDGNIVVTKLNNKTLKKIAKSSEGQYFEINANSNQTDILIESIQSIKGELISTKKVEIELNKYIYPLLLGLILLVFDVLVQIRIFKL